LTNEYNRYIIKISNKPLGEIKVNFEQRIKQGGYTRIVRFAENILLRPDDSKLLMGEERFNKFVEAVEKSLEEYKNDELYNYYYTFNRAKHGFCNFERWKNIFVKINN
jgi:hypothetical protein